jgi:glutamate-1-semialdehyde 2,1-aminomutase
VIDLREALTYDKKKYRQFLAGMHERGIRLIGRGLWYVSFAHTDAEIEEAILAAEESLSELGQ